jgi:hypothetical protein
LRTEINFFRGKLVSKLRLNSVKVASGEEKVTYIYFQIEDCNVGVSNVIIKIILVILYFLFNYCRMPYLSFVSASDSNHRIEGSIFYKQNL